MPVPLRANANLKLEARYNVVTEFPNYDLHSAAAFGNLGLVEYALTRGQPVNSVLDGVLPLHAACSRGHEQIVKLLIDHGADVNAARLPRRFSNEKNRDGSASIVSGTTGSTPLHFAASNGNKSVIMMLLLRGAHVDRRDKHGITPAMLAEQNGWVECAQVLNSWVRDKDRDLRERSQLDESSSVAPSSSFTNDDDIRTSARKHVQVKRSIDTALNMFKSGSFSTPSKLAINSTSTSSNNISSLSPTSPTRPHRDSSPSPSEDGRFSPSPSPIDSGSRRPSLPHVFQTPSSSSQRLPKPATLTKPRNPRRPRSAGTDAEQEPDADSNNTKGAGKKLGTKYSLLNLFKKGNESGGIPLERTSSHQSSMSMSSPSHNSSVKMPSVFSSSPKQSASPLHDNSPLPTPGYRFGGSSNDTSLKTRASSSPLNTRASPSSSSLPHRQAHSPPSRPLAVDLHNALAAHQHHTPNVDRSGSSGSHFDPPMGLGISFDEGDAQLNNKPPVRRFLPSDAEKSRDRSGSNASNRNGTVFDDEVVISARPNNGSSGNVSISESINGTSRNNSRPSILRGHNRTSSSSQQQRALRFDSSASGTGVVGRRESDAQPPKAAAKPLRECTSAGSLNRLHNERNGSPRPQPMALKNGARVPDSAPANIGDFDFTESEYGRPIESALAARTHLDIQIRNRGLSFTSSELSLSPTGDGPTVSSTIHSEFPFSLDAPPPIDELENMIQLQISPPPGTTVDSRLRGDSVSSASTADSGVNPSLSASATTSGSGASAAIPTPMVSPEGGSYLNLPSTDPSRSRKNNVSEGIRDDYRDGLEVPAQAQGVVVGLNERRAHAPLEGLDVDLIESHAQAEALVQRTQQDILSAHAGGHDSSGADSMPLSAKLAALGESLQLERRLRERKQAEELKAKGSSGDASSPSRTEILRRSSLDQLTRPYSSANEIQRPHANSVDSRMEALNGPDLASERVKPTHHPSLSASAVETSTLGFDSDESPEIQPRSLNRRIRSRTPDPDNDLSRMSSLEGFDDTELGPSLFRVSTAPNSSHSARDKRERELASNTKLTRMGFSPNEAGRSPPSKRFGGLKSLMQSLKGKQP
jgi:hypothetical protein